VIIDTGSKEEKVWRLYEKVKKLHPQTQILKWNKEFNFSAVCNFGAKKAKGEYYLFLNNDTEVITPDWIEGMLEHAQRESIGAVGCKLLYPNNTIQHAGVILGIKGGITKYGIAGHAFKNFYDGDQGTYFQQPHSVKNYSAVTAACLMIDKKKFIEFDPKFKVAFNDIDFCLKLLKKRYFNLYNGQIKLYHHESVSVGKPEFKNRDLKTFKKEILKMWKKWSRLLTNDPFYNKHYTLQHENFNIKIIA
jgi:GT2 family glycosyltransferase